MKVYPSEEPNAKSDKNYLKSFNRIVNESAEQIAEQSGARCEIAVDLKNSFEGVFDSMLLGLINKIKTNH